jgi:hypothetical protein
MLDQSAFQTAYWLNATRLPSRELRALTENFCGDPPPGYSALHGKDWSVKTRPASLAARQFFLKCSGRFAKFTAIRRPSSHEGWE